MRNIDTCKVSQRAGQRSAEELLLRGLIPGFFAREREICVAGKYRERNVGQKCFPIDSNQSKIS